MYNTCKLRSHKLLEITASNQTKNIKNLNKSASKPNLKSSSKL